MENLYLKNRIRTLKENLITRKAYSRYEHILIDGIVYFEDEDLAHKVRDVMSCNMKLDNVDKIEFITGHSQIRSMLE